MLWLQRQYFAGLLLRQQAHLGYEHLGSHYLLRGAAADRLEYSGDLTVLFKGIKKERISRLGYPLFAYAEGDADVTVQNCDNVWGYLFDKLELAQYHIITASNANPIIQNTKGTPYASLFLILFH